MIFILVILAAGIFALSYFFKPSRLELTPHMVILKVGEKDANYPYTVMKKETKHFSNLNVTQYIIESQGDNLIYEEAVAEGLYEFNSNPHYLLSKIFDLQDSTSLFVKNGLEALQLQLKDGTKLNLFMLQQDGSILRLLYGMSDEAFEEKVKKLTGKTIQKQGATPLKAPITQWSEKVNGIDGVLSSTDH